MAFLSLLRQSARSLPLLRPLIRHSNYCLISMMFATLCLALQAGSPRLLTGIVLGSSLVYLPLSLLNLWGQWQRYQAHLDRLHTEFQARMTPADLKSLGQPNCIYSARSRHLRCAVRPQGPCEGCSDFLPRS